MTTPFDPFFIVFRAAADVHNSTATTRHKIKHGANIKWFDFFNRILPFPLYMYAGWEKDKIEFSGRK